MIQWRPVTGLAVVVVVVAALPGLNGCQLWQESPARKKAGSAAAWLPVLHVRSELSAGAGFAVSATRVVTAAHLFDDGAPVALVEQGPMLVTRRGEKWAASVASAPADSNQDWAALCVRHARFTPPPIDPALPVAPGDKVVLGGFRGERLKERPEAFARLAPEIVEGTVCDTATFDEQVPGLFMVEVPKGDYHGFSGGPAAARDADGRLVIWGVVVSQYEMTKVLRNEAGATTTPSWALAVLRIPPEALDDSLDCSCGERR